MLYSENNCNPVDLIDEFSGFGDYAVITEYEYEQLCKPIYEYKEE